MGPGLGTPTQTITVRNCDVETAIRRTPNLHETLFITASQPFRALDGQVQCNVVISYAKIVYMSSDVKVNEPFTFSNSKITYEDIIYQP